MSFAAPKGFRLHIGIFGRRNVGKSSLLNAITRQNVSIVSDIAGTTTDPVEKPMELLPLGPVLFIDTAGIDDVGILGEMRVNATKKILDRCELCVLVTDGTWGGFEDELLLEMTGRTVSTVVVFNKSDITDPHTSILDMLAAKKIPFVKTAASRGEGVFELRQALLDMAPADFINNPAIVGDLVGPGETAILVVPIDKEAPKGRLILPQVQSIRDLLDSDSITVVVKERELRAAIDNMKKPPKLIVTDSQAFLKVVADAPSDVPVTGFSILFSRFKGDLALQTEGALAIDSLRSGDTVLIAESCSHHPIGDDIGRVKIPRWLTQYVGGKLNFETIQGHDFPDDLTKYKLVVHCGACMWNRREMLSRLLSCKRSGVPVTNYGMAIAYSLGILEKALAPFPAALEVYMKGKTKK